MARSDSVSLYHTMVRAAQESYYKEFGIHIKYNDVRQSDWFKEDYQYLRSFKETPREQRTREEWREFEKAMQDIYGPDDDEWGDY